LQSKQHHVSTTWRWPVADGDDALPSNMTRVCRRMHARDVSLWRDRLVAASLACCSNCCRSSRTLHGHTEHNRWTTEHHVIITSAVERRRHRCAKFSSFDSNKCPMALFDFVINRFYRTVFMKNPTLFHISDTLFYCVCFSFLWLLISVSVIIQLMAATKQ